jgi:hypothetical protein
LRPIQLAAVRQGVVPGIYRGLPLLNNWGQAAFFGLQLDAVPALSSSLKDHLYFPVSAL